MNSLPLLIRTVLLVIFLTNTIPAYAQYFTGAMASGAGGAGRANIDKGVETLLNPASLAHSQKYSSAIVFNNGSLWEGDTESTLGFVVSDNTEGVLIPGALTYLKRTREIAGSEPLQEAFWKLTVGDFVYEQLSFGISAIYITQKQEGREDFQQTDAEIGLLYNPNPNFGVALVRYNFLKPKDNVPQAAVLKDTWAIGTNWILTDLTRVRFDIVYPVEQNSSQQPIYQYGVETLSGSFNIFRLGGQNDRMTKNDYITVGWTFDGPKLKIDYAFRKNVKASDEALHSVDMRISF